MTHAHNYSLSWYWAVCSGWFTEQQKNCWNAPFSSLSHHHPTIRHYTEFPGVIPRLSTIWGGSNVDVWSPSLPPFSRPGVHRQWKLTFLIMGGAYQKNLHSPLSTMIWWIVILHCRCNSWSLLWWGEKIDHLTQLALQPPFHRHFHAKTTIYPSTRGACLHVEVEKVYQNRVLHFFLDKLIW